VTIHCALEIDVETRKRLICAAECVAIQSAEDAAGMCFLTTMEFVFASMIASSIELQLVRWEVVDDPDFCEHWAIALSGDEVIDLTRAQVDGNLKVLHRINSYPCGYQQMKRYPVRTILHDFLSAGGHLNDMSARSAIGIRWAMFRFDLANALFLQKPIMIASGLFNMVRFTWWALSCNVMRQLESRRNLLICRLNKF
jgi:hypothetical protein